MFPQRDVCKGDSVTGEIGEVCKKGMQKSNTRAIDAGRAATTATIDDLV
jgi:hypothetical protein